MPNLALPKAVAGDLAGFFVDELMMSAAEGVTVIGSSGDSKAAESMICPGGVMSGSRGWLVLKRQLCLTRCRETHFGGVTILWPFDGLERRPSEEATFLSCSLMVCCSLDEYGIDMYKRCEG